jgi:CheY-like chemotaxis protein
MMTLELEPANLADLLSGSLSIVKETALGQRVRLELEMNEDIGVFPLDLRKTKQIMYNLLSNAMKFSGQDGVVTLSAHRVPRASVGLIAGGWAVQAFPLPDSEFKEFVALTIRDTGIGISAENMTKLFMAFSQIDSSLARKFEGTGLGLAMVKRLAEIHGGTVAVASAEGEGSTFAVWLPIRAVEAGATAIAVEASSPPYRPEASGDIALVVEDDPHAAAVLQKPISRTQLIASLARLGVQPAAFVTRTVLVVDDDPKAVEIIATFLPVSEYTVVRAYGGAEAITLAERLRPDVVLLDLMMPDINGFDVVEALQRNNITARIPIIIVTAKHITEQDRTALSTGSDMVVEIVQKSALTRSDFVAGVSRAIQHTSGRV